MILSGLFFEKHLKYIKLNESPVDFTKLNMSYLLRVSIIILTDDNLHVRNTLIPLPQFLQENYDNQFMKYVYSCPVVTYEELRRGMITTKDPIRIQYNTREQYVRTAKLLGLMEDLKVSYDSYNSNFYL